jgi:phosphatidate cytidylyltransferase
MLKRLISAAVVIPLFILGMFQQPLIFRLLMVLAACLGFEEYRRMMAARGLRFSPWLGLAALAAILLPPALGPELLPGTSAQWLLPRSGSLGLAAFFLVAATWRVFRPDLEQGLPRFFAELGGLFYIGLLGLHVVKLHALPDGAWWCFLVFWYAWVYDSGALFAGKSLGKTRFNPLSPNKTWEGYWGGILVNALLSGLLLPRFYPAGFALGAWGFALLSVPASVLAQSGDLFESMLKRYAGVKDSSALIPAQGGFLDKMDSSLFVAPLVYLAATFLVP